MELSILCPKTRCNVNPKNLKFYAHFKGKIYDKLVEKSDELDHCLQISCKLSRTLLTFILKKLFGNGLITSSYTKR